MAENFPELSKYINPQMQYAQNIPKGRINIFNQHHTGHSTDLDTPQCKMPNSKKDIKKTQRKDG